MDTKYMKVKVIKVCSCGACLGVAISDEQGRVLPIYAKPCHESAIEMRKQGNEYYMTIKGVRYGDLQAEGESEQEMVERAVKTAVALGANEK